MIRPRSRLRARWSRRNVMAGGRRSDIRNSAESRCHAPRGIRTARTRARAALGRVSEDRPPFTGVGLRRGQRVARTVRVLAEAPDGGDYPSVLLTFRTRVKTEDDLQTKPPRWLASAGVVCRRRVRWRPERGGG